MDVREPRVRRRGFFLHSADTGDSDTGEHENPEGFTVRIRAAKASVPRQLASSGRSQHRTTSTDESRPQIRSGSVTGSRQRSHLPR
jgi:hypothetical protein